MSAIEGWMGRQALKFHALTAAGAKKIIEVGVWHGRTTKVLAGATEGVVFAVDTWEGVPGDAEQHQKYYRRAGDAWSVFLKNLGPEIATGKVVPIKSDSVKAAARLLSDHGPTFDFIFIDADHRYEAVRADIQAYRPLLAPGGILAGHDYHWTGVKRAVDESFDQVALGPGQIWRAQ
jgi:predicted O-methyltransferase YrrM